MPIDDLPRLGLGTWARSIGAGWRGIVRTALDVGYRHVDTARQYGNQRFVGEGIADSTTTREELFVATKVVNEDQPGPEYGDVVAAAEDCLDELGLEYVDLLYVHWPLGVYDPAVTMPAFDELRDRGLVRHVGVSNFGPAELDAARDHLDAPLAAHQVEYHPLLDQSHLLEYAREHDHWLVAYSPLAKGRALDLPELAAIAEKHDATPAQVSLAWLLAQDNVAAIPKASSREHLVDNLAARDLELDAEDLERIDAIEREHRLVDKPGAPWNQ